MARFQLAPGPIPLHHQVYLDLRAALDAGEWRPGDRLPPERDLAGRYGCSLITVRRALADLAREERLERTRGRGTFVTAPRIVRELSSTLSFAQEMELRGLEPRTTLLTARLQPAARRRRRRAPPRARARRPSTSSVCAARRTGRCSSSRPTCRPSASRPADRRPRARLAVRLPGRPLRLPDRAAARDDRAGHAAGPRGAACSASRAGRRRCSSRARHSTRHGPAGRVQPDVRARRPIQVPHRVHRALGPGTPFHARLRAGRRGDRRPRPGQRVGHGK